MKTLPLLLFLLDTVVSQGPYYWPFYTSPDRLINHGPFQVANRTQCEWACNCAREERFNYCATFDPAIPNVGCRAYHYREERCVLLGKIYWEECTTRLVEYEHISDPCENENCSGHGECAVDENLSWYCVCEGGYTGKRCEKEIERGLPEVAGSVVIELVGGRQRLSVVYAGLSSKAVGEGYAAWDTATMAILTVNPGCEIVLTQLNSDKQVTLKAGEINTSREKVMGIKDVHGRC